MSELEARRLAAANPAWSVIKLKFLSTLQGGGTPSKDKEEFWAGGDVPWVSPKDMKVRDILDTEDHITCEAVAQSATSFVGPGSPIIVARSGILRHTIPIAIARTEVTLNQDMKAFQTTSGLDPEFLAYWIEGQNNDLLLEWRQFGATVESLDTDRMMNCRMALPDLPTQKRIAAFLDRETARIDDLIAKKEQLVGLLKERGSAAREEMLWGDGPSTKLGHHISILPGYAFGSANFSENPDDIRLLRGANVGVDEVRWDDTVYWPKQDADGFVRFLLASGDIVMGMDRPWISGGIRVAQVTEDDLPCLLLQRVCKISPRTTIDGRYLKAMIESKKFVAYFEPILTGVSVPHISGDQIANFRFPFIRRDEQSRRMDKLERITGSISPITRATNTSIDRLREYRAALITSAVTGQIDVETYGKAGTASATLDRIEEEIQG
ncbi:restriction endonuclease subunit S [Defluviimonas salinarum]|uniref:Restriction endonuclease subunit S n=1 Tax=Defluviimonas salinarum TaxID=2992147 RepID=A0ABT3J918_9RHOB|nr:restriction endonuclease subunit S [Defluviimonas salinarum]